MAEIPPNIPASAAQAGFQARETAKDRDARRAGQADAVTKQVRTVDESGNTVETTDADVAIFADTEGGGSQGRAFEEEENTESESTGAEANGGITKDQEGQLHLDLEA